MRLGLVLGGVVGGGGLLLVGLGLGLADLRVGLHVGLGFGGHGLAVGLVGLGFRLDDGGRGHRGAGLSHGHRGEQGGDQGGEELAHCHFLGGFMWITDRPSIESMCK